MSLMYYDYEAELSDFADDLAGAIAQARQQYPTLSCCHHRCDDGNIAIIHERRVAGTKWEHIAYGYYLKFTSPSNTRVRFWIGKILYPSAHQPRLEIGIWADDANSRVIPHTIGNIQARKLVPSAEYFWDLPGSVPPYDNQPPSQWGSYSGQNRNAQNNVQTLANFLNAFLAVIP